MAEPKAMAVIRKDSKRGPSLIAENEEGSAERNAPEDVSRDPAQSVDPLSEVDRLQTNENAHLWSNLNHRLTLRKAVMSGKNWEGAVASARISIR